MIQPWPTTRLGEVGSVIRGVSFTKGEANNSPSDGLIPILRAGNIKEDLDTENDVVWVPEHRVNDDQILRLGDVVVSMSSGSPHVVGKTAQLRRHWRGSAGAFCAIVRFKHSSIVPRFGALWLRSPEFAAWRLARGEGANIQNLRKSDLEVVEIPVPPLTVQQRIVKLLDAAEELRRLRAEADRRTADLIPAIFHEMFGGSTKEPRKWALVPISEVAQVQGGLQVTPQRQLCPLVRPYLRVANVQRGTLILDEIKEIGLTENEYKRVLLQKDDLLLVEGNGNPEEIGRAALWDGSIEGCVHQNHLIRVRCDLKVLAPEYLLTVLNTGAGKQYFKDSGNTTSGLVTISTSIVKRLEVPLPPIALQHQFAARVAEVRALEARQAASRQRLDDLFQSMLHRAFRGDL